MNNILITNVDNSGLDTLVVQTNLDETDIWLMLTGKNRQFDNIKALDSLPSSVPANTSLMFFTERGEYEFQRELASRVPELAGFYPPWEELHPKKKARR